LHGTIGRMKGQPSDHDQGSPDADGVPTVAVGRFPTRSVEEARVMVEKTLAYERTAPSGLWRRHLTMLIGNPGGDSPFERGLAEGYVENACLSRCRQLPASWTMRTIMHLGRSPFTVPDDCLRERALKYLKEGQAITVYAGHSGPEGFWSQGARFLDLND